MSHQEYIYTPTNSTQGKRFVKVSNQQYLQEVEAVLKRRKERRNLPSQDKRRLTLEDKKEKENDRLVRLQEYLNSNKDIPQIEKKVESEVPLSTENKQFLETNLFFSYCDR